MNRIIYLEPDEEITVVINRIRKCDEDGIVLVIPRNGTIGQSIVNLKLLMRNADTFGKKIALVSSDKITKNLASQVGLPVFAKAAEAQSAHISQVRPAVKPAVILDDELEEPVTGGLKVNTYQKYSGDEEIVSPNQSEPIEENIAEPISEEVGEVEPVDEGDLPAKIEEEERAEESPAMTRHIMIEDSPQKNEEKEETVTQRSRFEGKRHIRTEGSRRALLIVGFSLVFIILAVSYVFLPSAKASMVLSASDLEKPLALTADKNKTENDPANLTLPATLVNLEKDGTKQVDATGSKDVGAKATGTITLSNNLGKKVTIDTSTRIVRDDKEFIPTKSVFVPEATGSITTDGNGHIVAVTTPGTIDVSVTAAETGDSYNLATGQFIVKGKSSADLWGENKAAFTGGVTKTVKLVTDDDLKKASGDLQSEITNQLKTELIANAEKDGVKMVEDSIKPEIVTVSADKNANDQTDSFTTTMKVRVFALTFAEKNLKDTVYSAIKGQIKSDEMIVAEDKSTIDYKISSSDVDAGTIQIAANFKGKIGNKIDAVKIKNELKNKSLGEAQNYLKSISGVEESSVTIWPKFLKVTPLLKNKISVEFDFKQ